MQVIVGCEESQEITKAFRELGHEAYSCDLMPCSGGASQYHLQMDVFSALLLADWKIGIFHPPCTDLAVSGAKHFAKKQKDGRQQKAIEFFMRFTKIDFPYCIENPVGIMSTIWRKPDQIVQPWMFGDSFTKTTCLWLNGLPPLAPTNIVDKGERHVTKSGKSLPAWYNLPPSENRSRIRSKTFPGMAKAIANQYGQYLAKGIKYHLF